MTTPAPANTCANCASSGTYRRPKILEETGFGDQLMFADEDEDETVYSCKSEMSEHKGQEIGTLPIWCSSWTAPAFKSEKLALLDKKIAEQAERARTRNKQDR